MGTRSHPEAVRVGRGGSIGARVRDLRLALNLSQFELAAPELSDSFVSLIENGRRNPSPAVLGLLADKLGCSAAYLLGGVTEGEETELRTTVAYAQMCLDNGAAQEAVDGFGRAVGVSWLDGFPELGRRARLGYALALEATGDLPTAVARLREFTRVVHLIDDPDQWAHVHLALCRCLRDLGDLDAAVATGEYALDALTRLEGWTEAAVKLGATLTAAYVYRGDLVVADALARRLLEHAQVIGSPAALMAGFWNSGLVAEAQGDTVRQLELYERALALLGEDDDPRNLARLRVAYGGALLDARPADPDRAYQVLARGETELTETAAGPVDRAWCLMDQARALIMMGRPADALRPATEAVDLLAGTSGLVAAQARIVYAGACLRAGDRDTALNSLTDAAAELDQLGVSRMAARPWRDIADLVGFLGDRGRELHALQHALICAGL